MAGDVNGTGGRRSSLWMVAAVVVVIVLVGGVGYWAMSSGTAVQAGRVTQATIREFVDERGKTRLPVTHSITMPFAGRVEQINLPPGTQVKQGQVLVQVSPKELQNEVDEAEAVVNRLVAQIAENADTSVEEAAYQQTLKFQESMQRTVTAAAARKVAGKQRVEFAERLLARTSRLFKDGAETEDQLDRARLEQVQAQAGYRQDELVWKALQAMESATSFLPKMVRGYIDRKQLTRQVLVRQREESEARLRQAELRRKRGTLTSPVDGVVLERHVVSEQFLAAGTPLLRIGQLERLEVEADVLSQDVVRIHGGQPVTIYGPALGRTVEQGLPGRVRQVYPGGFTKVSSLGVEQQRVKVVIEGNGEPLAEVLGVDYRVRVRVFTAEVAGALVVPRSALFRGADGGWQVMAIRHGRAALQPVEVGLLNDRRGQITAGLESGETVVLAPENSLRSGHRVAPILRTESVPSN